MQCAPGFKDRFQGHYNTDRDEDVDGSANEDVDLDEDDDCDIGNMVIQHLLWRHLFQELFL